jgi:hypothetical protein
MEVEWSLMNVGFLDVGVAVVQTAVERRLWLMMDMTAGKAVEEKVADVAVDVAVDEAVDVM